MNFRNGKGNKTAAVLLAIVLILPTIVAIVSYNIQKNKPISSDNVSELALVDVAGSEFKFENSDAELDYNDISSNLIEFFLQMNERSTPEAELPEPLQGSRYYKATFTRYGNNFDYRYYFTNETDSSFYVDDRENCYRLPSDFVNAFYHTQWAMSLFEGASVPVMTLPNGEIIAPDQVSWTYLTTGDNIATYAPAPAGDDPAEHHISESISFAFSTDPDVVSLSVSDADTGEEIFSGLYDDLAFTTIDHNTKLKISLNAEWNDGNATRTSYGNITYNFIASYTDAPVFGLGTKTVSPGEFTVVTIQNVVDPSTIKFASEPDIGFTPVFFEDSGCYRALVPISYDLEFASGYTFTVSADGVTGTLILLCTDKSFATKSTDISKEIAYATHTDAIIEEYKTNMASVYATQTTTKYWDGKFMDATGSTGSDGVVRTGYGVYRAVTSQGITYRHNGVDYATKVGDPVYAVNAGVVTYVGEQKLTGNVVVIDHGFGLMSTYAHMGDISVKVGDTVTTRQQIGTAGDGGFTDGGNIHVALTVFDVPVSIYPLWENGVVTG